MTSVRHHGSRGPTVVVLHGGPGAQGSVRSLAEALASDCQVIEPLQRRAGDVPLSVQQHVDDLARIAPERAIFVGWSWGAMLALSYGATHPERVKGIALVGCGTYHPEERAVYVARMDAALGSSGRAEKARIHAALEAATSREARDELLARLGGMAGDAQAFDLLPGEADVGFEPDAIGHRETWDDVLRLQAEGIEPARFSAIDAPVWMLHGVDDPHPGPETLDRLRKVMPQLAYAGFERCGHEPWRERHARPAFLATLRAWIHDTAAS